MISQRAIDGEKESELGIELDWPAYYEEFKRAHGDPIQWKGRLLFRDGWSYSLSDYKGPEYKPPTGQRLEDLKLIYWRIYAVLVTRELTQLEATIEGLRYFQTQRDVPLQRREIRWDHESQVASLLVRDLDLDDFAGRLGELKAMRDECVTNLAELKKAK